MRLKQPLFEKNEDWYYNVKTNELWKDYEIYCPKLTDKAPKEAVESYLEDCSATFNYSWGYVPEFVYEEYQKHMNRFEK